MPGAGTTLISPVERHVRHTKAPPIQPSGTQGCQCDLVAGTRTARPRRSYQSANVRRRRRGGTPRSSTRWAYRRTRWPATSLPSVPGTGRPPESSTRPVRLMRSPSSSPACPAVRSASRCYPLGTEQWPRYLGQAVRQPDGQAFGRAQQRGADAGSSVALANPCTRQSALARITGWAEGISSSWNRG